MMRILLMALLLLPLIAGDAFATSKKREFRRDDLIPKDSIDYTLDDGVMSKEEMEMEAQDVYALCNQNAYQKKFFNCSCLAGAFLQQREKRGPMITQNEIFTIITNSAETDASCANVAEMAGNAYNSCISFSTNYSRTEMDTSNEDYCTCAANKSARDFSKAPRLSSQYIEEIRRNAMIVCRDPKFRKDYAALSAKEDAAKKAAETAATRNAIPALNAAN